MLAPTDDVSSARAVAGVPVRPVQPLHEEHRPSEPVSVQDEDLTAAQNVKASYQQSNGSNGHTPTNGSAKHTPTSASENMLPSKHHPRSEDQPPTYSEERRKSPKHSPSPLTPASSSPSPRNSASQTPPSASQVPAWETQTSPASPKLPKSPPSPTLLKRFSSSFLKKASRSYADTPASPPLSSTREQPERELSEVEAAQQRRSASGSSKTHSSRGHDYSSDLHREQAKQAEIARAKEWNDQEAERSRLEKEERERLEREERDRRAAADRLRREEEYLAESLRKEQEAEAARLRAEEDAERAEQNRLAQIEKDKQREEEKQRLVEQSRLKAVERQKEHDRLKGEFASLSQSGGVMLRGFLSVQGGNSIMWKRRWFELSRGSLLLFKSQTVRPFLALLGQRQ